MKRDNCSIKKRYAHLKESERYKIEVLLVDRKKVVEIAKLLRRNKATIYREIKRGAVMRLQYDLTEKTMYRAHVGQIEYEKRGRNKERSLKIGKDKDLEEYIRVKLVEERFSPDAIIGEIKVSGRKFSGMICTKTLYNYIDKGIFSGISNNDLWQKRDKKRRKYHPVGRVSRTNRMCRSIEKRPLAVEKRRDYGHWEGDTVKGPRGSKTSLITLTERKSREEIIMKVEQASQKAIQAAFDELERKYGDGFRSKFKSITFDNGVEFLDWRSLEISVLDKGRRTTIYFAHSFSAWERGTNENHNRMIRRFVPKGTDIADLTESKIDDIEDWMNDYPRKILAYKTPKQVAAEYLQNNGFDQEFKFCRN
ncbi:MAG: IS30 family transposase [Candidatus Omnitrophota bacterium]|jgi:IS30 family transposase